MEKQTSFNATSAESCELSTKSSMSVKFIKTFAFSIIMSVSLLGNLAVIAIVSKNKRMWTTTNYLIANMAASDLLMSLFTVPRELVESFTGPRRWLLDGITGSALCKLVYFFQDVSVAVSIQSLVVIAIDRYRDVVFPFRPPVITSKVCKVIIPIIWMVAMCIHGACFYTAPLVTQHNKLYCIFSWAPYFEERPTQERYLMFIPVFSTFVPLCVILTLYTLILIELRKRKPKKNGASAIRRQRQTE